MTRQERSEVPTNLDSSALGGSFGSTHRMCSEISVRFRGSDGGAIECGVERSSQNAMFMEVVARPAPRCCQLPPLGPPPSDVLASPGSWPPEFRGRPHRRGRRPQPGPDRPARPAPIGGLPRKIAAGG